MNDFLPAGYETPDVPSKYMEFAEGLNRFRILSSAIVGYEWWEAHGEAGRKPHRVRALEEVPAEVRNTLDDRRKAKHFWAFAVYNYDAEAVQVLVLKQQTIMRPIEAFGNNPKWGSPKGYDLIVEKTRTGSQPRDVEYSVIPEPPTPLDPGIAELAKGVPVDLEALYRGEDPFAESRTEGEASADEAKPRRKVGNFRQFPSRNPYSLPNRQGVRFMIGSRGVRK